MRVFYTYLMARPTHEVFYVGKSHRVGKYRGRGYDLTPRNRYFENVVNKHGHANILTSMIPCSSEEIAFSLEVGLIKCLKRNGHRLTNLTQGGEGFVGGGHTDASKQKTSNSVKLRWRLVGFPLTGRKQSPQTIYNRSNAIRNAWTEEKRKVWSERMSGEGNGFYGKNHTPEMCREISERNARWTQTPEMKRKFKASFGKRVWMTKDGKDRRIKLGDVDSYARQGFNLGRSMRHTPENKEKQSIANRGDSNPMSSKSIKQRAR